MDVTLGSAARPETVELVTRVSSFLLELLGILTLLVLTQSFILVVYKAKELLFSVNFQYITFLF